MSRGSILFLMNDIFLLFVISYDPTWKVSHRFLIDRKKRTLLRFCERKKLLLKVYHSRFFGKDAVIATGELELAPLLTQCEIREKYVVMHTPFTLQVYFYDNRCSPYKESS